MTLAHDDALITKLGLATKGQIIHTNIPCFEHHDLDFQHSKGIFSQYTLAYEDVHQTEFGHKKTSSSEDVYNTNSLDYMSP